MSSILSVVMVLKSYQHVVPFRTFFFCFLLSYHTSCILTLDNIIILVGTRLSNSSLFGKAHTSKQHNGRLSTENDYQRDKSANHTSNRSRNATRGRRRRSVGAGIRLGAIGSALAARVAADVAPVLVILNGKLGHAVLEIGPGEGCLLLAKERERRELVLGGGAIGKEEADADVVGGGLRVGRVGDEFKGHGRGVVADAVEIGVGGGELGETEKGHKGAVGAELGVEARAGGWAVEDGLQRREDLAC